MQIEKVKFTIMLVYNNILVILGAFIAKLIIVYGFCSLLKAILDQKLFYTSLSFDVIISLIGNLIVPPDSLSNTPVTLCHTLSYHNLHGKSLTEFNQTFIDFSTEHEIYKVLRFPTPQNGLCHFYLYYLKMACNTVFL